MKLRGPRIGDTVTTEREKDPRWDGTVVDVIPDNISPLYRVYWRYPLGKVADYRDGEIKRA
jgi:hypothetical protein